MNINKMRKNINSKGIFRIQQDPNKSYFQPACQAVIQVDKSQRDKLQLVQETLSSSMQ